MPKNNRTLNQKYKEKPKEAQPPDRIHAHCQNVNEHANVQTCRDHFKFRSRHPDIPASTPSYSFHPITSWINNKSALSYQLRQLPVRLHLSVEGGFRHTRRHADLTNGKLGVTTCPGITSLGEELMPRVRGSLDCTHQPCTRHTHVTYPTPHLHIEASKWLVWRVSAGNRRRITRRERM